MTEWILILNVGSTFYMLGVIWLVHGINYRLFSDIGRDSFVTYHKKHVFGALTVAGLPMTLEGVTAMMMLWYPHPKIPITWIWTGVFLVFVIWLCTLFLQIPCHDRLGKGYSDAAYKANMGANRWRVVAWTARAGLVVAFLTKVLS